MVGGEEWQEKVYDGGMEEAPENGKESPHSVHANGLIGCTGISSPFYPSRFAVIWLRYEPWMLNTNIEHYC